MTPAPTSTPDVQITDNPDSVVTQTLLVQIDASQWIQDSFATSPDKKHIGYISAVGANYVMFIDGKKSPEYSGVLENTLKFSPDSQHYAYAALQGTRITIIQDGKVGKRYKSLEAGIVFSPDSKHLAYGAAKIVATPTPLPGTPTVAPQNPEPTAVVEHLVVLDAAEGKNYDSIVKDSIEFSPDNTRVGYVASSGGKQLLVLKNVGAPQPEQESKPYESIFSLTYSPDGKHVGFAATAGTKRFVVIDGKEGKQYKGVSNGSPIFSPDSKHSAYVGQTGDNAYAIVMDGQESKTYEAINGIPVFSPDSKHLVYAAKQKGKLEVVIHDLANPSFAASGKEGKQYDIVGSTLTFSPDGQRLAYVAGSGSKQEVVIKDAAGQQPEQEQQQFDGVGRGTLLFSPDSKRLVYVAGVGTGTPQAGSPQASVTKQFIVLDGAVQKQYDGIARNTVTFSPDSKRLAYAASVGAGADTKQFVVLDGKEGKQYDVAAKGGIIFTGPNDFYYLGVRNILDLRLGNVYLVGQRMK